MSSKKPDNTDYSKRNQCPKVIILLREFAPVLAVFVLGGMNHAVHGVIASFVIVQMFTPIHYLYNILAYHNSFSNGETEILDKKIKDDTLIEFFDKKGGFQKNSI